MSYVCVHVSGAIHPSLTKCNMKLEAYMEKKKKLTMGIPE
jgi:hypothetical protein